MAKRPPKSSPAKTNKRAHAGRRTVVPPASRRLAVLIGNGRVRNQDGKGFALNIPGVDKDLELLGGVLTDSECAGFEVRRLLEPKLIDVRREIARAAREVGPEDTLIIYYSGTSVLGDDKLLYLPVIDSEIDFLEATCLDSEYVLSCMRRSRSRRQLVMMDGCHSGAFFAFNRGIPDGFCAIMSCGPEEYSYCDKDGGFFTRALVDGLQGAAADADGDGTVDTDELFRYVVRVAKTFDPPATPQLWTWNLPEPIPLVKIRLRVFLCYRRVDSTVADDLVKRLERDGYAVWIDRADIRGGSRWSAEVDKALQQSDAVILLLSKSVLESDEIYRELTRAIGLGKPIIPISLEPVELHGWYKEKLGSIQHIIRTGTGEDHAWYPPLTRALRNARKAGVAAAPGGGPTASVRKKQRATAPPAPDRARAR